LRVAVVGAGISGLQTAILLEAQGCQVTVFEARDRIGGRLLTVSDDDGPSFEAGGEWLDADQPLVHALVKKYQGNLDEAVREPALAIFKGEIRRTDDLWLDLLADEETVELMARSMARELTMPAWTNTKFAKYDTLTLASFIRQHCQSDKGYWWMTANLRSDEGDDLSNIGLLGWLTGYIHYVDRENLNRGESEMSAYRAPMGFSNLLESMRADLKGEVVFDAPLQRIQHSATGVTLHFESNTESFDAVVLTLPPRCLERVVFEPALDTAKRCAIEACGMSRAIKIVWEFTKPWWKDRGFCGRLHVDSALQQLWEGTRGSKPILTAYICGERAVEWTNLGDPVNAGVYELTQFFPEAKELFVKGQIFDWINDPYSLGAFSHYAPGYTLGHAENMVAPHGRIHFAGEHTATWVGFIEGALESAHRVTSEVLAC
jgi:monoamine oxidase